MRTLLRAVSYGWQQDVVAESARAVSDAGRELAKRLGDSLTHLSKVGRALGQSVEAYNRLVGAIERRVLPQLRRLGELGITSEPVHELTRLELPITGVEQVEGDTPANEDLTLVK